MAMEYTSISTAEQLLLARDLLRAKESDHFRLSIVSEPNTTARIQELEGQIEELRSKISELESEVPGQADVAPAPEEEKKPSRRSSRAKKESE